MTNIIKFTDTNKSILLTPTEEFDFQNPQDNPVELAKKIADAMMENMAFGISANQIGLPYRVFAIKTNPVLVCFNPKIVSYSEDSVVLEEACLSYPNMVVKIKRPRSIRLRYTLPNGEVNTERYTDFTSRIIQHEMDHLEGIAFYRRANYYHRSKALKKVKYV